MARRGASSAEAFRVALGERQALLEQVARARARAEEVRRLASQLDAEARDGERRVREIERALGLRQLPDRPEDAAVLRGEELRRVAVRLLAERCPLGTVHYTAWYAWLLEAGHRVGGADPQATFLAAVAKAPEVERVGARSGRYQIRPDAPAVSSEPVGTLVAK